MEDMKDWRAKWIWTEGLPRVSAGGKHELVYFRRSFQVPAEGSCRLVVDVSADSRYRLFLNGESVSAGPCKGDSRTYYYETVDLSDRLRPGENVLAAKVLHYAGTLPWVLAEYGPLSIWRSEAGGFLLEGSLLDEQGELLERMDTDERWRCLKDEGYGFVPLPLIKWVGGMERVDGSRRPHGWETADYDDSHWPSAVPFYDTRDDYGELTPWPLQPRPIPPLFERPAGFERVERMEGAGEAAILPALGLPAEANGASVIAGNSRIVAELDAGQLTTGFIRLELTGGRDATVRILYAECYEPEASDRGHRVKGIRSQSEGGKLIGENDTYLVSGIGRTDERPEIYEPFEFRTFRYVRLEIETAEEALGLRSIRYRETGYPLEVESEFDCSDPELSRLWTMGIRTLQLCMHETYEDCPYYEQMQYTKDTRLMMRYQYGISTDDRLARRALYDYHGSLLPTGMLQCRVPSVYPHVIPAFSLEWIFMLQEHYAYFGDLALIRRYRPTVLALLDWFERKRTPDGLVGPMPPRYWTHFDWVNEWPGGAPPLPYDEPMTLHSLMYAAALSAAAELLARTGWREIADEYRETAREVNAAVIRTCWREERQLFSNSPLAADFSQHPQVWAVLSGAVTGEEAKRLLKRTLQEDLALPVLSLPATYQLFRAFDAAGLYEEEAFAQWDRWRRFIGLALTTFPEEAIVGPRSDCHGWSALPLAEFPARILGVSPGAPGFERIQIRPYLGTLSWARGKAATVKGPVGVDWQLAEGRFRIRVDGPQEVPIDLTLPNGERHSFSGAAVYECAIAMPKNSDHRQS